MATNISSMMTRSKTGAHPFERRDEGQRSLGGAPTYSDGNEWVGNAPGTGLNIDSRDPLAVTVAMIESIDVHHTGDIQPSHLPLIGWGMDKVGHWTEYPLPHVEFDDDRFDDVEENSEAVEALTGHVFYNN